MNSNSNSAKVFLIIIGLAFLNVGLQAFYNPQIIMDFVNVKLNNVDAFNSIRAYYGGVNTVFAFYIFYGAFKNQKIALTLCALYGIGFVIGRLYSIIVEGMPGSFILTWLIIETVLAIGSIFLLKKQSNK